MKVIIDIPEKLYDKAIGYLCYSDFTEVGRTLLSYLRENGKPMDNLPTVNPTKVGRWEYYWNCNYDKYFEYYKCSECDRIIKVVTPAKLINYPYCHCGAKMEGGVNCNAED